MNHHLHPVKNAKYLDSQFRHFFQNPQKILRNHIHPGMTVLDLGCGTGYFTIELLKMVGKEGKVIAVDLQEGMLDILKQKLKNYSSIRNLEIKKCQEINIAITEKVDFILAFYTLHEMKYFDDIILELKTILKPKAKIFISEQKFHVSKKNFAAIIEKMNENGFTLYESKRVAFSRTVLMGF